MAFDEELAARVRDAVEVRAGGPADEKKMFGGLVFLVNTHMAVGLHHGGGLIMTVGAGGEAAALEHGAVPMERSGWVTVPDEAVADDDALAWWVDTGVAAARARPAKNPRARSVRSGTRP
ncbi:TfoX/Sxy family protein [Xylanimonas protaetiae]|uniref:TfoX family protein n=1 Tax=Xylanimonas protaetiae TaxID=2509457 RepID=A0A4P6FL42_9MICO|nr:TfoX/Sxy family protein [Xylanimonas protaetiae]QAY71358.1 TfoX family protein [Xylanimonas protaetiae]